MPWNYPLTMATWKLAPALAAGCTIVLKPDAQTPLTALRMAELATEVGFPPGALNVVPGAGKTVGAHLVQHPGVDKIAFTGSTATGAEIMRLGSDAIKRLTLELGGKSPNLVFADANLDDAMPSRGLVDLLLGGAELRGAIARAGRAVALRRVRAAFLRRAQAAQGRRPARGRDADGLAHLAGAP